MSQILLVPPVRDGGQVANLSIFPSGGGDAMLSLP
jgi:hypothetical protein